MKQIIGKIIQKRVLFFDTIVFFYDWKYNTVCMTVG